MVIKLGKVVNYGNLMYEIFCQFVDKVQGALLMKSDEVFVDEKSTWQKFETENLKSSKIRVFKSFF